MPAENTAFRASVIIPTRNNFDTLPDTIRSVRLQQLAGFEIIVVDDGSTDGTREWLAEIAAEDASVRVIHTESLGPAGARNAGISISRAEIIAFVDSDDTWARGKLRFQVEYMEKNPEIGMTFTDYRHVGVNGDNRGTCFEYWNSPFRHQPPTHFFEVENPEARLLACNLVGTSTVAVRKSVLQTANGFATHLRSAEDWDLWLRIAGIARVAATSMVSTIYLMRPGSLTARGEDRIAAMAEILARYENRHEPGMRGARRAVRARLHRARAEILRAQGARRAAALAEFLAFIAAPERRALKTALADLLRPAFRKAPLRVEAGIR